jgi:hypothetical protein
MKRMSNYTIISWQDFAIYGQSPNNHLYFQEKLFDTGVIEFHYGVMDPGPFVPPTFTQARGSSATVWIERPDGTGALAASINAPNVLANTAWRFTPN